MPNLFLRADRIPTESKKIKLVLNDEDYDCNSTDHYEIIIKNNKTFEEKTIVFLESNDEKILYQKNIMHFDITHSAKCYGTEYIYYAVKRRKDNTVVEQAVAEQVHTLPSKIKNLKINYDKSLYTLTGIPNKINLSWDKPNIETDNYNLRGYVIYYSICARQAEIWSKWEPLCETSTESQGLINIIDKNIDSIDVDVPQVCNFYDPHNIRFSIVSICNGVNEYIKSRASNVEDFTLKEAVSGIIPPYTDFTIKLTSNENNFVEVIIEKPENNEEVACILKKDPWIPHTNAYKNKTSYEIITNQKIHARIIIIIKTDIKVDEKYEIRVFEDNKWVPVPSTYNIDESTIVFTIERPTRFALLRNKNSYNIYDDDSRKFEVMTNKIIKKMPSYLEARSNPYSSMSGMFLNVIGLQLEDIKFMLDYAYKQTSILTADVDTIDIIYKAQLPKIINKEHNLYITSPGYILEDALTLENFMTDYKNPLEPEIYYNNPYIIDYEKKIIYVKKPYNKNDNLKNGFIIVEVYNENSTKSIHYEKLELKPHHVWNFFDEFGLLLNTPRLPLEKNKEYKERLLDVFKNPSNSSKEGLMNGIARELGIRINRIWEDTSQDFIIKDPMVITNMIKVGNIYVNPSSLYITDENYIIIKSNEEFKNNSIVTYVSGLEMHTFNKSNDEDFKNQLYNVDGTATKVFKYYVDIIKKKIPLDWGQFKWDIGYWDTCKETNSGTGFIPHVFDANIEGFKNYK